VSAATPESAADREATLHALLDAGVDLDAEYRGHYANHRPMALVALHALGADSARMRAWAAAYSAQLQAAPAPQRWPAGDAWAERLGDPAAWPLYRGLFREWLLHEGADAMLQQVLPQLMAGCGGAAFHGLLRTASAVRAGHGAELADGLAYWASRWLPLGRDDAAATASTTAPAADLGSLLARLQRAAPGRAPTQDFIVVCMAEVAARPGFDAAAAAFAAGVAALPQAELELARHAAALYAARADFTLLHLITSAHALSLLQPWLDDPAPALRAYARAYAAAWLASGAPARAPAVQADKLPSRSALATAALRSDNEHVIKLVDVCLALPAGKSDMAWRRAAARALQPHSGG
jgi:hypothetical protein